MSLPQTDIKLLVYIINHLFLPSRLPQSDDHTIEGDLAICDLVIRSSRAFEADTDLRWASIVKMLEDLRDLQITSCLEGKKVQKLMTEARTGDNLIFPVRAQNACVIVRRLQDRTVYESFEIDPPNTESMATKGRIIRAFPGPALEVADKETTTIFQTEFASFLAKMDAGDVVTSPIVMKAKSERPEIRDTADPHYITHMLTAIIHGLPNSQPADIERVEKRVRNEIMWESGLKPWRRSPLWLIIRVALQTTLTRIGGSRGQACYKAFMIHLLADVLLSENCHQLPTHLVVCLGDKVSLRLQKFPKAAPEMIEKATSAIRRTQTILRERWDQIQRDQTQAEQAQEPRWAPATMDPLIDTHISLLSSKKYLFERLQRPTIPPPGARFQPSESPRITDDVFHNPSNTDKLSTALAADPYVALTDVEEFVQERLDLWVENFRLDVTACVALGKCLTLYVNTAKVKYADNPEDQSLMLLTIFQLWRALDQLVVSQHPMLKDYSPEVPESLLEPLLLRKSPSIQHLIRFQNYLRSRHRHARLGSIFTDNLTQSFAVRYFNNSRELSLLKRDIEDNANEERAEKLKELKDATARYRSLKQEAESIDHAYDWHGWHRRYCRKCSLEQEADGMNISIHEWPLPRDDLSAKAVVFELRCPPAFQTWRTTTYTILFDVVQADSDSIFVNNALNFRLFDESLDRWVSGSFLDCAVGLLCTFKLPPTSPYFALQYAIDSTTHSANQPIAEQANVPPELDLHQHVAFGTLRSGAKIQWLNIVRELRARTLSFYHQEVQLLVLQAALQIGPISGGQPEWHSILTDDPTFGKTLLSEVDDLLSSIKGNWRNMITLQTVVILTERLLVATEEESIITDACDILRKARGIASNWMLSLLDDLEKTDDEAISDSIQRRICTAAATCRATYDVDRHFFRRVFAEANDVEVFIQCSVHVLDCTPSGNLPTELKYLLARDRRLSQSSAPELLEKIQADETTMNNAIRAVWSIFNPGPEPWRQLPQPNGRWLTSMTSKTCTDVESTVHLNMFDGTLLISGKPLGRLPTSILTHPTYIRLLGQKTFNVIPSVLPNMDFATRNLVFDNVSLHFKLSEPSRELIIKAKRGTELYELIPHTVFNNNSLSGLDFPSAYLEQYAHWLQLSPTSNEFLGHVEFHPLEAKWKPSQNNWHLRFTPNQSTMRRGSSLFMVDIRSETFAMVAGRLRALDTVHYLHIKRNSAKSWHLSVDLPRYKLSFFLNGSQELESKTIRAMVIDSNQSTGTMFGLDNQLVLKSVNPKVAELASPGSRSVIIPFGNPTFQARNHHIGVHIPLDSHARLVKYFKYDVDVILGRLIATTLLSDLYKIYLHACTSFPLPDPLTRRTGTEEALSELGSAKCLSFQKLGTDELKLLHNIADLSPVLEWYPEHLHVMQTIHWHDCVGPLAQHWAFVDRVQAILQFQQKLSSFNLEDTQKNLPGPREDHLQTRFRLRTSRLYALEDVAPSQSDRKYPLSEHLTDPRSATQGENSFRNTADVSALVQVMPPQLQTVTDLWAWLKAESVFSEDGQITLSYQSKFLQPSLSSLFLPFYNQCRHGRQVDTITRLTFSLAAIAYNSPRHIDLLPTLLAFATLHPVFRNIDPPPWNSYDLNFGVTLDRKTLASAIKECPRPVSYNQSNTETIEQFHTRQRTSHLVQIEGLLEFFARQWPREEPYMPPHSQFPLIDLESDKLKTKITGLFRNWFKNMHFQKYVHEVQQVLDGVRRDLPSSTSIPSVTTPYQIRWPPLVLSRQRLFTRLDDLLARRDPPIHVPLTASKLDSLVKEFTDSPQSLHRRYGSALEDSLESYARKKGAIPSDRRVPVEQLQDEYQSCRRDTDAILGSIQTVLLPKTAFETAEHLAGRWPVVTIRSLLALLLQNGRSHLNKPVWRDVVVRFAQSIVKFQRAQRLLLLETLGNKEDFLKEFANDQFETNPSFHRHPEWLLIQIDGNFTVRPIQSQVAEEMISPRSAQNTLLQLNMGEGKSSVIIPLVSATLAKGDELVRVVVLKPLAHQMFHLLVRRLSGLANRRIFYLPFSRDFKPTLSRLALMRSLYETCIEERGILLVQPEHILSFKLMGIDLAAGIQGDEGTLADTLLASQRWLTSTSRDVLDESDEILSVTYQLVYTSGLQEPLENHPDRWNIIQEILGYVKKHACRLRMEGYVGLEVEEAGEGEFPTIRILDIKAGERLIESVANEMALSERLRVPQEIRQAALDFVMCNNGGTVDLMESSLEGTSTWKYLLLCRGFIMHGLLQFILNQKRWRVDYGLDPTRTLLAVPYRAKDVPSLRADFGHPDVAIALTCLSYYYGGLTENQLDTCFHLLFKLDDRESEYRTWISGRADVPESLCETTGVNLEDEKQWRNFLVPLFGRNQAVINFYLSSIVFPKDAKQFPKRFATSSWDLAETKTHVTIGFSGTNDNQYLLPTSIAQRDPLNQLSTNAQVLSYLLRPENDNYVCLDRELGQPLPSVDFLKLLVKQRPPLRVLLDVGAQMLDMRSTELACKWLELVPDLQAIVFFDEADELVVMSRDQTVEPLLSSQFSQKLDLCAIYLDDAHTRGTDLKLPKHFRAAVTLGPRLTKDRLVQGCMRMRMLGSGQSVMFFAPPEVDRVIRELGHMPPSKPVEVVDILRWVMQETCEYIQHHLSHWAQQGVDYKRRKDAWTLYESKSLPPEQLRISWEEPDARSLEMLYAPQSPHQTSPTNPAFLIPDLKQKLDEFGVSSLDDSEMDEEHERELDHEAEQERQVERPERAQPARPSVHEDVRRLIINGTFAPNQSSAFVPLFSPLDHIEKLQWSTALFSTKDFAMTIKGDGLSTGYYLRPVHWIISLMDGKALVVLSPYEVDELLPMIRESRYIHLHIYSPRFTQARASFEQLTFFSIPPLPDTWTPPTQIQISQVNLWAGQLYLKDYITYKHLCLMLGIDSDESSGAGHWKTGGFVEPRDRNEAMMAQCQLKTNPLPFLKELFSSRRKGMNYSSTHMGKVLEARRLTQGIDFDP